MTTREKFMVIRQDDNGVKYAVADKLTLHEAQLLVTRLSDRGHKQLFFYRSWLNAEERRNIMM